MERFKRVLAWLAYAVWTFFVTITILFAIPFVCMLMAAIVFVLFTPIEDNDTILWMCIAVFALTSLPLSYANQRFKFVDRVCDIWKPKK